MATVAAAHALYRLQNNSASMYDLSYPLHNWQAASVFTQRRFAAVAPPHEPYVGDAEADSIANIIKTSWICR
jgi:hypothetical protein